jgi:hypothetical protein
MCSSILTDMTKILSRYSEAIVMINYSVFNTSDVSGWLNDCIVDWLSKGTEQKVKNFKRLKIFIITFYSC